jgi:nitrate reductase cytochrome c-type subunit
MRGQDLQSLVLALLVLAPVTYLAAEEETPPSTPDTGFGLSKTSVFDVPSPDPMPADGGDPGDQPVLPRFYDGSPPVIPHGIADFLPITRQEHLCLDCHEPETEAEKVEGEPTPIPRSHLTDLRLAPETVGDRVVGARYLCIACHVPNRAVSPLVDNRFGQ